jgi:hypothetical protein
VLRFALTLAPQRERELTDVKNANRPTLSSPYGCDQPGTWKRARNTVSEPAPPALNLSTAVEPDRDVFVLNDDGYFAPTVGVLQHPRKPGLVLQNVDIVERNFAARESLTGSRCVGSKVLPEDEYFCHGCVLVSRTE